MVLTYSDPQGQVGSNYTWKGNKEVGQGEMTIEKIDAPNFVECKLHFIEPFEATPNNYFRIEQMGESCKVIWGMKGESPFPMNLMQFLMKGSIQKSFDEGLTNLKIMTEYPVAAEEIKPAGTYKVNSIEFTGGEYVGVRQIIKIKDISAFMAKNFPLVGKAVGDNKLEMSGPPTAIYYSWDDKDKMETDVAVVMPVKKAKDLGNGIKAIKMDNSKALLVNYNGAYDKMMQAHTDINSYMTQNSMEMNGPAIEQYITDPMTEKDTAKWETKIIYLVKGR
ncbi:MAG: GyrI-like domain-containing protein [Bacteroidia bacterium]|nr:GyrI-like domain-containing protein [Bacteroidia bacterium]